MRKLGVGGIPAVAICPDLRRVDWLMGLDYNWFSTMWGVYFLLALQAVPCRCWC